MKFPGGFVLLLSIMSCLQASELPVEHRWSASEIALLKSLWIGNLKHKVDETNRVVTNLEVIKLGHKLFFDKRFSLDGKVACSSCHHPNKYFTDGLATAKGIANVTRNTPTIVGSSQHTWFFRDGRADSLWSQALGPLENVLEHGGNRTQFAHIVFNDRLLRQSYEDVFGKMPDISNLKRFPEHAGPVENKAASQAWQNMRRQDKKIITDIFVNLGKALAAYETQLQPAASRFDFYIRALVENNTTEMQKHLSIQEVKGLRVFLSKAKCTVCHSGPMLTDNGFHNISVPARVNQNNTDQADKAGIKNDWGRYIGARQVLKNPFNCRSQYNDAAGQQGIKNCDELEYIVMDQHETQGAMKTPGLRNVAKTAPYMHAGQYKTLREVIEHYDNPPPVTFRKSELFLNFDLDEQEVDNLEAFLKTLNSPINAAPELLVSP